MGKCKNSDITRLRLVCEGAVQGVGFRPTVYRVAKELNLKGFVKNSPSGVIVEIEGLKKNTEEFIKNLTASLPPIANISAIQKEEILPIGESDFKIIPSETGKRTKALTSFDSVVCKDCRKEMEDKNDRRYRYPFINCTNCGPRFTIISSFPYDRQRTSMARFKMCDDCLREYKDPSNRRYHAEAICCPKCGPQIWLTDNSLNTIEKNLKAVVKARNLLEEGKILAIKGLGGFHLAVRADYPHSIKELRERKKRKSKPFAVMVKDLETAKKYCHLSECDLQLLDSPKGPILIAPKIKKETFEEVAPQIYDLGIFIPTTPLHIELFRDVKYDALVMTSGNISEEPIAIENQEAFENLKNVADYFLFHNREILRRLDDSLFRSSEEKPFVIRRSRGFVPEAIKIGWNSPKTVLATGAFLQNTACILNGNDIFFTPHIGDLDNVKARKFYEDSILSFKGFLEVDFDAVAVDLHKDYPSTTFGEAIAKKRETPPIGIQHHLAHLSAIVGEKEKFPLKSGEKVYGIILDGTGLGTDGTSWGGEFLKLNYDLSWERVSHLQTFPLIGNEKAVVEPWRVALALLKIESLEKEVEGFLKPLTEKVDFISLSKTTNWQMSSGAGRLFEAAGALCGLTFVNNYEGESASLFESLADCWKGKIDVWSDVSVEDNNLFPTAKFFASFFSRIKDYTEKSKAAMEFHYNFVLLMAKIAERCFTEGKIIGLSGGCFVNRILRRFFKEELEKKGFDVLLHYNIPCGDGGISFGQAILASRSLVLGLEIREV